MTIAHRPLAYTVSLPADGPADAVVHLTGRPDADAVVGLVARLHAEPWYRPGIAMVIDFSACDPGPTLDAERARDLASRLNDARGRAFDTGAVAIVATGASAFGTLRMTISYQEIDAERDTSFDDDFPVRAFSSLEAALAWLATVRLTPS